MRERETNRIVHDERGAMALVCLFMAVFLVAALFYLVDLGSALTYRERMQDAADATAYGAAAMHARGMNVLALMNMVMAALLAVLVALNLIETFVVVGMVMIAACGPFPWCVPFLSALVPLERVRTGVAEIRDLVKPEVLTGLSMLHIAEHGLRLLIPVAAEGVAMETAVGHYDPHVSFGFVLPPRATLPTVDANYSDLCAKAGEYAADFALKPFNVVGLGIIKGPAEAFIDELVKAAPPWFCAATDANHAHEVFKQKYKQVLPALPARQACAAADPLGDQVGSSCEAAKEEDARSMPDATSGACNGTCDAKLYRQRVELARAQCNPNTDRTLEDYQWQERTVVKHYTATRTGLVWLRDQDEVGAQTVRDGKKPPCPANRSRSFDWSTKLDEPVCSSIVAGAGSTTQSVLEVTEILSCDRPAIASHKIKDMSKDPALGAHDPKDTSRSPQTMEPSAALGDASFQLRAVVVGRARADYEKLVRVATWGRPISDPARILPEAIEQLGVAQAEYYFDGSASAPSEWLWHMDWKARLRRFRMPNATKGAAQRSDAPPDDFQISPPSSDFGAACGSATTSSSPDDSSCTDLTSKLHLLDALIVH